MKLLYTTMYSALLMGAIGLNATAQQQLPNSGFEDGWAACKPWTSDGKTTEIGENPANWCISHVAGMYVFGKWNGSTSVGGKDTPGYNNSNYAVNIINSPNPVVSSQIVPGYITLGTTWSTAKGATADNKDGGSFGGIEFTSRPTGIEFMYKRSRGTEKPDEKSTVVAYLWKGHKTQAAVPGNIGLMSTTAKDMVDRDRCVLDMDMNGYQGGKVTPSSDFELIGYINTEITENTEEWKKFSANFTYDSDATPEYLNVIIAAGDYFGGASVVGKNNSLTIDDVRVFYNYSGYLNIKMEPLGLIAENQDATIQIVPTEDNKCTFTLPNFNLASLGLNLGDIVVNNVTISEKDGEKCYEGSVDGLKLQPEGAAEDEYIVANVSLSGTTNNMKIAVDWLSDPDDPTAKTPIEVTFTKEPVDDTSGITNITVDNSNAPVEFYNLQGIRVNGDNLTPGIYVRRQGSAVSKILVK